MVLRLLAVERERIVVVVMLGERRGRERDERDALVGRTEEHVERNVERGDRRGVTAAELRGRVAGVEQAGIEEVRAHSSGLEREFAESKHSELERKLQKLRLVRLHRPSIRNGFGIIPRLVSC